MLDGYAIFWWGLSSFFSFDTSALNILSNSIHSLQVESSSTGVLLNHFPTQSTLIFLLSLSLFEGRGRNNNFSTTSQDGVSQGFSYHLHSSFGFTSLPLSGNLSREFVQVAPYGKYFSSIMVLGFPVIASTLCRPAKFISNLGSCRR